MQFNGTKAQRIARLQRDLLPGLQALTVDPGAVADPRFLAQRQPGTLHEQTGVASADRARRVQIEQVDLGYRTRRGVRAADQRVRFTVRDAGTGLKPEELERLTQPFARDGADSAGSLGLGLTLVARIALAHGGTLHVGQGDDAGALVLELPSSP